MAPTDPRKGHHPLQPATDAIRDAVSELQRRGFSPPDQVVVWIKENDGVRAHATLGYALQSADMAIGVVNASAMVASTTEGFLAVTTPALCGMNVTIWSPGHADASSREFREGDVRCDVCARASESLGFVRDPGEKAG